MKSAIEVIKKFWEIQDEGDYTKVIDLFSKDALFEDPVYGTFRGKSEILEFMKKMNEEMRSREMTFRAVKIDGGGEVAWTQWIAESPDAQIEGCGLYRVENGLMTYYRDYMNAPSISNDN
ncbi:MAG: nuclear transport factor 2 family protein [Alphaproteobacteria bacterium]